jgi:glycine cleavage system aminomethyltransferase T
MARSSVKKGHAIDGRHRLPFRRGALSWWWSTPAWAGPCRGICEFRPGDRKVGITDLTDRLGKIDVQGPAAGRVLSRVLAGGAAALDGLPYFSFKGHFGPVHAEAGQAVVDGGPPVLLSRTGYTTGEFGFELFVNGRTPWPVGTVAGGGRGIRP